MDPAGKIAAKVKNVHFFDFLLHVWDISIEFQGHFSEVSKLAFFELKNVLLGFRGFGAL